MKHYNKIWWMTDQKYLVTFSICISFEETIQKWNVFTCSPVMWEQFLAVTPPALLNRHSHDMFVASVHRCRWISFASAEKSCVLAFHKTSDSVDTFSRFLYLLTSLPAEELLCLHPHHHWHVAVIFSHWRLASVFHHLCCWCPYIGSLMTYLYLNFLQTSELVLLLQT